MTKYNPQKIEKEWQGRWEKEELFKASGSSKKKKYYVLVEFPYPSGEGLHVGHCRSYIGLDVIARKRRMEGFNVLFPMGWDAFGLPTENYAIKTGIHPRVATERNTKTFRRQQKSLGLSFDWSREINTTDPSYYKWTQWIFIQLFKKGLAYKLEMPVNWCPSCKIVLANEEVVDGKCERCGEKVVRKEKEQWVLKITKYADRLIEGLDKVDYPERVKILQKEWIGRSEGTEINFKVSGFNVPVFTTRPDTLFGATYLVLAPENPVIEKLKDKIDNSKEVEKYIEKSKQKPERERIAEITEKTGIEIKGIKALNPVNDKEIPIFIADYVLMHYGTGAIMAVPAHDQRDFDFAKLHNLSIIEVINPMETRSPQAEQAYEGEGVLVNSGRFNGMPSEKARVKIVEWLKDSAKKKVHYRLRDWIFSRQHYWGDPTPMVYCQKCGWIPVPEKNLPVVLPEVKNFKPDKEGNSPLGQAEEWINTKCPKCGGSAKRETDVMPNWAGSNWYYLAYLMRGIFNFQFPISKYKKVFEYWMPVDWYNGGMEHTTLHLLYSRFIYKFLWDIKAVPKSLGPEPYKKRTAHGMILGEGGIKMSKSKGNVITPDEIIKKYSADTLRVYEMFMGPFDQMIPWNTKGVVGVKRFLEKVWKLKDNILKRGDTSLDSKKLLHKTIKKVSEDIESMKFNTAISSLMELVNVCQKKGLSEKDFKDFLKILSPFAPHLSEELWEKAGFKGFCCSQKWPEYDKKLVKERKITLVVQINGKVRDKIEVETGISEKQAKELALSQEKVKKWLVGKKIRKIVFVPEKLINFVVWK